MSWILFGFLVLILLSLPIIGVAFYKNNYDPIIPCLEDIAKDYCEGKGLSFNAVIWNNKFYYNFQCGMDDRSFDVNSYKFLPQEIKECKEK